MEKLKDLIFLRRNEEGELPATIIFMGLIVIVAVIVGGLLARAITNRGEITADCINDPASNPACSQAFGGNP